MVEDTGGGKNKGAGKGYVNIKSEIQTQLKIL